MKRSKAIKNIKNMTNVAKIILESSLNFGETYCGVARNEDYKYTRYENKLTGETRYISREKSLTDKEKAITEGEIWSIDKKIDMFLRPSYGKNAISKRVKSETGYSEASTRKVYKSLETLGLLASKGKPIGKSDSDKAKKSLTIATAYRLLKPLKGLVKRFLSTGKTILLLKAAKIFRKVKERAAKGLRIKEKWAKALGFWKRKINHRPPPAIF